MKQILTVFSFTFKDAVRKKAFILSTILIMAAIGILCAVPGLMQLFKGDKESKPDAAVESALDEAGTESSKETCYYVDEEGLIAQALENLTAAYPDWNFVAGEAEKEQEYREEIKENEHCAMIKVTAQDGVPFITVVNKDVLSGISMENVIEVLSNAYIYNKLLAEGIAEETIQFAQSTLNGTTEIAGSMNLSGYIIGIVLVMLTFFAVYYYGYGVAMSVATEKTTRVMETLVVSAKPSRILIGKCLGMGALGLFQFASIFLFSAICYKLLIPADFLLGGMPITLDAFTPTSAVLIAIFFILGYSLYAMLNAVCGAGVSKIEDLNSAMMPVMLVSLVSFYIGYFSMIGAPADSIIHKIAIYVPFCSPFSMPFKLLNSDVPTTDIAISIIALVVSILVISVISIRLYSASVLHYGKKLKLKELYKLQ